MDEAFSVNLYYVDAPRPALIDSGTGWNSVRIADIVKEYLGERRLHTILLTHRHVDHVGGAAHLTDACSTTAYASGDDAPAIISGDPESTGARMFGVNLQPVPVRIIEYGGTFDIGEGGILAIHTPGHTIGSVCLFHEPSGSLFTGDTVFANGGVGRWDLPTGDYDQLLSSLRKLSKMKIENLYPGHGPYVEGDGIEHIELGLGMLETAYG